MKTCSYCDRPRLKGFTTCEYHREYYAEQRKQLKLAALDAYGGRRCQCGETDVDVLTIDHIEGGGNQHRKTLKHQGGSAFYQWLKNNNYPPGFRVLCANCNWKAHVSK